MLSPNDTIVVSETRQLWTHEGEVGAARMRCNEGWVTLTNRSGAALFAPIPAEEWNKSHWANDAGPECEQCHVRDHGNARWLV